MARKVFFSFHYKPDNARAAQVRNAGVVEGNRPVADNDWETVTRGGEAAIERWIDNQLSGKSCVVVLIGAGTAGRKWIDYEIIKGWNDNKGVVGVRIHNLRDFGGNQAAKGGNPFSGITFGGNSSKSLSSVVNIYDPPYTDSKDVYACIKSNLETWVDEAVAIRSAY